MPISFSQLSADDKKIVLLVFTGHTDEEIGREIAYPPATPRSVARAIARICREAGLRDRSELVAWKLRDNG